MIAVDWSHTKDLTTYDGKKVRIEDKAALLKRLTKGESKRWLESKCRAQPLVLEQGCPLSLIYYFTKMGIPVHLIDNKATENYRKEHNLKKSDEADARIIYELATNGIKLQLIEMDNKLLQMHDLYHQYCRYQKARVAMQNMKKAHQRQYGSGESNIHSLSIAVAQPDLLPYDIAIDTLKAREKSLLKRLELTTKSLPFFEAGGESKLKPQSIFSVKPSAIKGLGQRIWLGLMVTCNPSDFKCPSAYLRFCGLTNDVMQTHKYNRHAKMLYHMLAEEVMKQRDPKFRPIYDKCKADIALKFPIYTKLHIHNAALNRTATFLAKEIFRYGQESSGDSKHTLISIGSVQPLDKGMSAQLEHSRSSKKDGYVRSPAGHSSLGRVQVTDSAP